MKTKTESRINGSVTVIHFNEAMQRYAAAERREAEINKTIETEVNEVLGRFEDELMCLAQAKQTAFGIAHAYCAANKAALFAQRRSIGTGHGVAGFRLGTPALKTRKGSSWKKVLTALKEKLPAYVRITEEPAKALLLADRHKENVAPLLVEIGVEVVQEELFYIETGQAA